MPSDRVPVRPLRTRGPEWSVTALHARGSAKSGMWARRAAMAVSGPGPGPEPAQWLTACKVTALLPGQVSAAWRFAASDTPTLGAGLPCFYRSIRAAQALG